MFLPPFWVGFPLLMFTLSYLLDPFGVTSLTSKASQKSPVPQIPSVRKRPRYLPGNGWQAVSHKYKNSINYKGKNAMSSYITVFLNTNYCKATLGVIFVHFRTLGPNPVAA